MVIYLFIYLYGFCILDSPPSCLAQGIQFFSNKKEFSETHFNY